MHYRYQVIRTDGVNGTTIRHTNTNNTEEDSGIYTLGEINGYTYIYAESLGNQPTELTFEEVTLTTELLNTLKEQNYIKQAKLNARAKIRYIKDLDYGKVYQQILKILTFIKITSMYLAQLL